MKTESRRAASGTRGKWRGQGSIGWVWGMGSSAVSGVMPPYASILGVHPKGLSTEPALVVAAAYYNSQILKAGKTSGG